MTEHNDTLTADPNPVSEPTAEGSPTGPPVGDATESVEVPETFVPADHTVDEVKAHLLEADPLEFVRVLQAEAARGDDARSTLVDFRPAAKDVAESEDGYTRVVVSY